MSQQHKLSAPAINLIKTIEKIGNLKKLSEYYRRYFNQEPHILNRSYLKHMIIYRIQEIQFGGLTAEELQKLENYSLENGSENSTKLKIAKGTIIRRVYKNVTYEVISLGNGSFEFNGIIYNSLSAIARAITGTNWNGRIFFGL